MRYNIFIGYDPREDAAFAVARFYKNLWIAVFLFLALSAISIPLYLMVLRRLDQIAIERREVLVAELCRA